MAANNSSSSLYQGDAMRKNETKGLRSPGTFARRPVLGWLLFIFGGLMFAALFLDLRNNGPLLQRDKMLANTLPAIGLQNPAILKPLMDTGFYFGGWGVTIMTWILAIYFLFRKSWQEFMLVLIGMGGGSLLFLIISNLVDRLRPPTQIWIVLKIPGFPSGHTIAATMFFGLMAYLLEPKIRSGFGKFLIWALAILLMLYIGFTRIFTAAHYLTDVLAGYAIGIAWSGAAYTLVERYFLRRRRLKLTRA